jgi:hypothetical protein
MQSLQKEYTAKGVIWLSIDSSAPGEQGNYPAEKLNQIASNDGAPKLDRGNVIDQATRYPPASDGASPYQRCAAPLILVRPAHG